MAPDDPTPRISVSRDALRADLAEMELRLRIFLEIQLSQKADADPVKKMQVKVDAMERGDFSPAHKRALAAFVEERTEQRQAATWTVRERAFAILYAVVGAGSLVLGLTTAFRGGA